MEIRNMDGNDRLEFTTEHVLVLLDRALQLLGYPASPRALVYDVRGLYYSVDQLTVLAWPIDHTTVGIETRMNVLIGPDMSGKVRQLLVSEDCSLERVGIVKRTATLDGAHSTTDIHTVCVSFLRTLSIKDANLETSAFLIAGRLQDDPGLLQVLISTIRAATSDEMASCGLSQLRKMSVAGEA